MTTELKDRMEGCLLGVFCGDALGAPIEFRGPDELHKRYPRGVEDMVEGWDPTADRWAGFITDDSEMAVALLTSLVRVNGFDAEDATRAYQAWLDTEPNDVGCTVANKLIMGCDSPQSEANGTLMRIAPVALYAAAHPGWDWAQAAAGDAVITHCNPKCPAANIIYVESLILALQGADPLSIYSRALGRAEDLQQPALRELLEKAATEDAPYWPSGGWLHHAFQATYYWLLHAKDFRSALLAVVNQLGDPDTNGAIVGAMLGALFGRQAIPEEWEDTLLSAPKRTEDFSAERGLELLAGLTRACPLFPIPSVV